MANDLNEEEAVVIGATASLLGATAALLRNLVLGQCTGINISFLIACSV